MSKKLVSVITLCALVLIGDFALLMVYGYALRSTNLFVARSTVFYPLAWLNLLAGLVLLLALTLFGVKKRPK